MSTQHQRTVAHPSREELLAIVQDEGQTADYYDSMGHLADDEEEAVYARALGYNPTII